MGVTATKNNRGCRAAERKVFGDFLLCNGGSNDMIKIKKSQ